MSKGMQSISARDVQAGDLVDLQGDKIADVNGEHPEFEFEYARCIGTERETADCVRLDFESDSFGFPPDHLLSIVERSLSNA